MAGKWKKRPHRPYRHRHCDRQRLRHNLRNKVGRDAERAVGVRDVAVGVAVHRLNGRAEQHQQHAEDRKQKPP